jgi:hypothetical protein
MYSPFSIRTLVVNAEASLPLSISVRPQPPIIFISLMSGK